MESLCSCGNAAVHCIIAVGISIDSACSWRRQTPKVTHELSRWVRLRLWADRTFMSTLYYTSTRALTTSQMHKEYQGPDH